MRVLVTFAVDTEFAPWRKLRKFQPVRVTPTGSANTTEIWETLVGDTAVSVYLTGIAGKFPREAMLFRESFYEKKSDFAISSGLAGALNPAYVPGDVLAASMTGTKDDSRDFPADAGLLRHAAAQSARIIRRLLTADRIIGHKEEKRLLSKDADAVDMESALLMKGFAEIQLPAIAIRAVSDGQAEDMPIDFARCITSDGKVRSPQLIMELASHPSSIPSLIRFGRQSKRAAANLAAFLDGFISSLPEHVSNSRIHEVAVP